MQHGFTGFAQWSDLLAYVASNAPLFYHAPLDYAPTRIRPFKVYKNGKVRIDPLSAGADCFTADPGHLGRFRRPLP